jgi:hypothetical protein
VARISAWARKIGPELSAMPVVANTKKHELASLIVRLNPLLETERSNIVG